MRTAIALAGSFALFLGLAVLDGGWPPRRDGGFRLSCRTFPIDLSEADLVARYGAANVTAGQFTGSDDGPVEGTIVLAGDTTGRLEVRWRDASKRGPEWVQVRGDAGRWRTAGGVALGMDLPALERLNRRPFRLAGFANEVSGRVRSWGGGELESPPSPGCTPTVSLGLRHDGSEDVSLVRQVGSGLDYSSGHPAMQALNPRVVELGIRYSR